MNINENSRTKILTDGDTFLNRWSVLRTIESADIYLSGANYILAESLLDESVQILKDDREKMNEYCEAHLEIGYLYANREVQKEFDAFKNSKETILGPILLTENGNLRLFIFKGLQLSGDVSKRVNPMTNETIAYAQYMYDNKEDFKLLSMNDEILNICKEYNAPFKIGDLRF